MTFLHLRRHELRVPKGCSRPPNNTPHGLNIFAGCTLTTGLISMISGNRGSLQAHRLPDARRRLRALLLVVACGFGLSVVGPLAHADNAFDLDALLSMIGKVGPSHTTFNERKFLKQFHAPVDSSGELLFQPPATLVMRTLRPKIESMRVDGQTLTLERGRLQRTLQLAEHPEIAVFIEPIRAALAGDRAALERGYATELQGEAAQWKLQLTPKASTAGAAPIAVQSLLLSGRQGQVRQIEVRLADGDYSVMNIDSAAAR